MNIEVELPNTMVEEIQEVVEDREDSGYKSKSEFIRESIKSNLLKYKRTIEGIQKRTSELKWPNSNPPFGYDLTEDGRLEINSREAEYVEKIFRMYDDGYSYKKIAEYLNRQSIQTKQNNEFSPRAVGDIIKNEIYTGLFEASNTKIHLESLRIISDDLFESVESLREKKANGLASRFRRG